MFELVIHIEILTLFEFDVGVVPAGEAHTEGDAFGNDIVAKIFERVNEVSYLVFRGFVKCVDETSDTFRLQVQNRRPEDVP